MNYFSGVFHHALDRATFRLAREMGETRTGRGIIPFIMEWQRYDPVPKPDYTYEAFKRDIEKIFSYAPAGKRLLHVQVASFAALRASTGRPMTDGEAWAYLQKHGQRLTTGIDPWYVIASEHLHTDPQGVSHE